VETFAIRDATRDDVPAIHAIRVRGWQTGYRHIFSSSYLAALDPSPDLASQMPSWNPPQHPNRRTVAVSGDRVVGFAFVGAYRDDDPALADTGGEIYALYVDPVHWGHGIGKRLLADAIGYLTTADLTPVRLWVLTANTQARHLYEAHGFSCDHTTRAFRREHAGLIAESTETRYTLNSARP
jgi:ribosomal protein S18 acetylase RimI-like enzyme